MGLPEIIAGLVILIGVVGTLVPVLPGPVVVWGAALGYGLMVGFDTVGWMSLTLITLGLGVCIYLGIAIPRHTIADEGLGWKGQLLSLLLALVGMTLIPVVGAWVGLGVGVFVIRYHRTGDAAGARRSTLTTLRAIAKATVFQFLTTVVMAGVWLGWVVTT